MFCSSCGNQVADTLTYCNRCGTRLSEKGSLVSNLSTALQKKMSEKSEGDSVSNLVKVLQSLMTLTGFVALGGLGIILGLIVILLDKNTEPQAIMGFVVPFLAVVFFTSFLLIRQLTRVLDAYLKHETKEIQQPLQQPLQFSTRNTAQIEEPKESFISVTENTTRTLDSAFHEKKL